MTTRRIISLTICILLIAAAGFGGKETPPPGGPPKDFRLPKQNSYNLPNGLSVTMVRYGTIPKVTVWGVLRTGAINEKAGEIWMSALTCSMMKEGTTTRSAADIRRLAATMGGSLDLSPGDDQTTASGDVLSESGPEFVALMGDVLMHPLFPESELPRLKNDLVRNLSLARSNPQALTSERFENLLYGNHPYGRGFPTDSTLLGYTIGQVKGFYTANFGARRAHLYIVGQFDEAAMKAAIVKVFGSWAKGPRPVTNVPTAKSKKQVAIVDRPGAPQSTIDLGLPVIDPSRNDYLTLQVMNSLLGGSFASRITSNIREQKGYTYSPSSAVTSRYRTAYWSEKADVSTAVTGAAIREILGEIRRLRNEAPPAEELEGIVNYMAGIYVLRNSTRPGIIGQLSFMNLHGLPQSYLTNYVRNLHAITPKQIQQVTEKYIRPNDIQIVITGDRQKIHEQVAEYGMITN